MNCPFCNTENPNGAVYCKHCGKKLDETEACPQDETQANETVAPMTEVEAPKAKTKEKKGMSEKAQIRLRLASGILMMVAVVLSLICSFFIGIRQSLAGASYYSASETYNVWHYFGRVYYDIDAILAAQDYSSYTAAAYLIPAILSTIVAAGTLASTIAFTLMATVKFGLHFKRANVNYYKSATAAVFSFILGATLFDAIHSVSTPDAYVELNGSTVTGLAFCCLLIVPSLILRTISIGNGFKNKQTVLNFVCGLISILFLAMISGFAISDQADCTFSGNYSSRSISLHELNRTLSLLYGAGESVPADFTASFVLAVFAMLAQIALQVLVFIALIRRIGNYTEGKPFSIGLSTAIAVTAALYLTIGAISVELANGVIAASATKLEQLWLSAEVILPFVVSLLYLSIAITCVVVSKKDAAEESVGA